MTPQTYLGRPRRRHHRRHHGHRGRCDRERGERSADGRRRCRRRDSSAWRSGHPRGVSRAAGARAIPTDCPSARRSLTTAGNLPARFVVHTVGPIWGADEPARQAARVVLSQGDRAGRRRRAAVDLVPGHLDRRVRVPEGRGGGSGVEGDRRSARQGALGPAGASGVFQRRRSRHCSCRHQQFPECRCSGSKLRPSRLRFIASSFRDSNNVTNAFVTLYPSADGKFIQPFDLSGLRLAPAQCAAGPRSACRIACGRSTSTKRRAAARRRTQYVRRLAVLKAETLWQKLAAAAAAAGARRGHGGRRSTTRSWASRATSRTACGCCSCCRRARTRCSRRSRCAHPDGCQRA